MKYTLPNHCEQIFTLMHSGLFQQTLKYLMPQFVLQLELFCLESTKLYCSM